MGSSEMSSLYRLRWKDREFLLDLGEGTASARLLDSETGNWESVLTHSVWTLEKDGHYSLPDGSIALFSGGRIFIHTRGRSFQFLLKGREGVNSDSAQREIKSPMPGKVIKVEVAPGDAVRKGQTLAVVEAMKMEHALKAGSDSQVEEVRVLPGDLVLQDQIILILQN
ncbi:biotin/lipoyl-binding protein [Leptospira fluminis]|uniref:Biotin/lipoyl-binding protein n=1 Tax=Leptospira fluminis TaxID=2484979 RepID=A0A4V3JEX5_9LEPT|nr:acetyl-CoA carboxylase biotin carboxyl carrier protein subunit [Leptospira fluminis]TGK21935.1 biotin/lipoyl-binding protein [Leptospira fluminis]